MTNATAAFRPTTDAASRYLGSLEAALGRVLRGVAAVLEEPAAGDPQRAFKLLPRLVATLDGFTLGTIAAEVIASLRRTWGADAIGRATLRGWPGPRIPIPPASRYLADAATRPLVGELTAHLYARFAVAAREIGVLIQRMDAAIAPRSISLALERLPDEGVLGERLASELRFGWQVYAATLAGLPLPSTADRWPRSQALWEAWRWRLAGRPEPVRDHARAAGYITVVG